MKIGRIYSQEYVRMSAQNRTSYVTTNYKVFMKISPQFMQNYIKSYYLKHRETDLYQSNELLMGTEVTQQRVSIRCKSN